MVDRRKGRNDIARDRRKGDDRRSAARYAVGDVPARFTWDIGCDRGFGTAQIVDFSQSGLCMRTTEAPPRTARVWVELELSPSLPAIASRVVSIRRARWFRKHPSLVRLRFDEPCPYDVFSAVFRRS